MTCNPRLLGDEANPSYARFIQRCNGRARDRYEGRFKVCSCWLCGNRWPRGWCGAAYAGKAKSMQTWGNAMSQGDAQRREYLARQRGGGGGGGGGSAEAVLAVLVAGKGILGVTTQVDSVLSDTQQQRRRPVLKVAMYILAPNDVEGPGRVLDKGACSAPESRRCDEKGRAGPARRRVGSDFDGLNTVRRLPSITHGSFPEPPYRHFGRPRAVQQSSIFCREECFAHGERSRERHGPCP